MNMQQRRISRRRLLAAAPAAVISATQTRGAGRSAPTGKRKPGPDWPLYRHDAALSGVSPGKGRIVTPDVRWEYYLGAPYQPIATDHSAPPADVADLDGDGRPERFSISGKTLEIADLSGRRLWSHTVDGQPLDGNVRVARLFPDRKGLQIIAFASRMDTGEGQGYCFTFHLGAEHGELAWTTGPLTGQYSPTLVIDDVDGDGNPEVVTAPHYRVQIFNGQTGALKAEVPVAKGRNYGILLTRPRPDRQHRDIYVVCDFVLHVECVRFQDGKWTHAWEKKYLENENAPVPHGRERYLRVGANPVADLDGDGRDEVAYMLVDAATDDTWHLVVHDGETGRVKADVPGIWLWSIADLDGDGRVEIAYTPTREKRPRTFCEVHFARLSGDRLVEIAALPGVRPALMNATLPPTANTIADEGLQDLLRSDVDGDGVPELFFGERSAKARVEDSVAAVSLSGGRAREKWRCARPGHHLNLVHAGQTDSSAVNVRVRDLTAGRELTLDESGRVTAEADLGRPGGFSTTPIVVDLDGDGRNEIVLQNAAQEIVALRPGRRRADPPEILWSVPGVAMNPSPGYAWNGALCPQAADVDGDGRPEVLFAAEDDQGQAALVCVDGRGRTRWAWSFAGYPWGGLQAGVNLWTFGRFTGRKKGLDVYVDAHHRSKGSSEGWVLRGDTGEVVWHRQGLVAKETAMPFGSGLPAVADVNGDGIDDLIQEFYTVYGAVSGATGEPVFPPAFLWAPEYFGKWVAYSWPTVADLNDDGKPEVYLNSASYARGAYAAVHVDGKPLWAEFHNNDEGSDGFGPVGDFDGDGKFEIAVPVLNGTLLCMNGADGKHRWQAKMPVTGDVVAADVNGDGVLELLFAGRDGRLRAVSGRDGREVWSIVATGRPVVADVDGDGLVEVLCVGGDGVLRVIGPNVT